MEFEAAIHGTLLSTAAKIMLTLVPASPATALLGFRESAAKASRAVSVFLRDSPEKADLPEVVAFPLFLSSLQSNNIILVNRAMYHRYRYNNVPLCDHVI